MNGSTVDFTAAWSKFWTSIAGSLTGLTTALAVVGVLIVAGGLIKFFWDKRRGGGGNTSGLIWTLLVGCLLAGPNLMIPLFLALVDALVNTFVKLFKGMHF